jgi:hypothetical protein
MMLVAYMAHMNRGIRRQPSPGAEPVMVTRKFSPVRMDANRPEKAEREDGYRGSGLAEYGCKGQPVSMGLTRTITTSMPVTNTQ